MKKFNEKVGRIETMIAVAMLVAIVVLVFVSAITRFFGSPIIWSIDLAQLLFIWISMLGADAALKKKSHIGVDLIVKKLPTKFQNTVTLVTSLLILAFLFFMLYQGSVLCIQNYLRKYATLNISYSFGTAAVPIGSVFMILTMLEQIIDLIKNWSKPSVSKLI
ncbi:Tripartite ATP-independent periplasmic transporter, DctQ component [Alkaliphilus metalliredigens QYMF]|uniref:Tripartite ATP-independent periplasmic transporter, DctQ component n=1 Tax=Alkaliphilus metalliredigens (strain QYMF) TaxID=293826 RepID=A6TMS6_ALKMQ|nr:TRAP transporter small permease [Alkaliphilus metalliredigens]ABR47494.1 Tripartite ATP-independent periplasmic transporter, DctQ component [Alkaliphilus metalliredigens QYMF]